jgi:hypothetical protein
VDGYRGPDPGTGLRLDVVFETKQTKSERDFLFFVAIRLGQASVSDEEGEETTQ